MAPRFPNVETVMIGISNLSFRILRIMSDALDSNNQDQHNDQDDDVMLVVMVMVKGERVLRQTYFICRVLGCRCPSDRFDVLF